MTWSRKQYKSVSLLCLAFLKSNFIPASDAFSPVVLYKWPLQRFSGQSNAAGVAKFVRTAAPRIAVAGRPHPRGLQLSCRFEGEEHAKLRAELVKAKGVAREGKSLTALDSIAILQQGREEWKDQRKIAFVKNDVASSSECEVGVDYGTLFGGTETLFRLCSPRSEIVSVGKFKEGGRLDRLDKFLSGPIFRMEVPKAVEAAIVIPGSMFGVMLKSLVMLPTLVPLLLPGPLDVQYLIAVTLPFSIWGGLRIRQWMLDPLNMRLIMAQKIVPYIGPIHMLLAAAFSAHVDAVAAVSFYVCTWFYSQLVNQSLKNTFWRSRPTTSLSEDRGELAARHFPQFKMRLKELPECLESFPSGDSAGAGAFGFCATVFTGNPLWLLVTVAGMFGRVFIHAHHIFDVVIGGSIGVLSAALLDWSIGGWQNCGIKHMLLATAFSFVAHKIVLPRVKAHKMEEHGGGREHAGTRASVFTKERLQGMT